MIDHDSGVATVGTSWGLGTISTASKVQQGLPVPHRQDLPRRPQRRRLEPKNIKRQRKPPYNMMKQMYFW